MENINLALVSKITSPNPVSLICTKKEDGENNIATVSWFTYLSYHPEMVGFAMSKKSYTGEMVRKNGKVVLAIPGEGLEDIVKQCGSSTGRDVNKIVKYGIEMEAIDGEEILVPSGIRAAIFMSLKEYIEVGDHYLYICNVDKVFGDMNGNTLYAFNGYSKISKI